MRINIKLKEIAAGSASIIFLFTADVKGSELHQEDGILSNHSAEYVRTLNRNTSTDPDAAFYNPAGLAFMQDNGLYLSFSTQTYYVKKTHSMDFYALHKLDTEPEPVAPPHKQPWFRDCLPDEYFATLTAPALPGFDIIWKEDKWAAFLDIAVMQAALDFTYPRGLGVIDWGNLLCKETPMTTTHLIQYTRNAEATRNEMYIGITAGGAYELADWLSAGGGIRVIHAQGNMKVKVSNINYIENAGSGDVPSYPAPSESSWDIDTDTSGIGYGVILSTHLRPGGLISIFKGLEASFRAEYYLPMELEKKTNKFLAPTLIEQSGNLNIFKDGSAGKDMAYTKGNGSKTLKVTYPTTVNFGLSYLLFDWINLLSSAQISLRQARDLDGREKDYNMGYQVGGGVEFITSPKVTLSAGYLYNDFGIKPNKRTEADPLLSSHQIGAGACFHVDDTIDVNVGGFYQIFIPATSYTTEYINVSEPTNSYIRRDYDETRYSLSIGVTYKMLDGKQDNEVKKKDDDKKPDSEKVRSKGGSKRKELKA